MCFLATYIFDTADIVSLRHPDVNVCKCIVADCNQIEKLHSMHLDN